MIFVRTSTTATDWTERPLEIDFDKFIEFNDAFNTPKQRQMLEQGLSEGWIRDIIEDF